MRLSLAVLMLVHVCFGAAGDSWTGTWYRNSLQDSAGVVITAEKPGSFHFVLTAYSGTHTGEIEGDAVVEGNAAQCVLRADDEDREVSFLRTRSGITVLTANCEGYYGGVGVLFDGDFAAEAVSEEALANEQVAKLMRSEDLVRKMRATLGTSFVSVAYRLHLVSPEECLDDFEATVISGCVQGICPEMAAIVMFTPKNQVYIAWLEEGSLYYISSDVKYRKKLPQTIVEWTKQFEGAKIIHK